MGRMSPPPSIAAVVRDAAWLAHRFDPGHDAVHFVHVPRAAHRATTFLSADRLVDFEPVILRREDALAEAGPPAPVHFIFHSAFCCSTLLARALDLPGHAMGLKEPYILQDIVGWRHLGAAPAAVARATDGALTLLARPLATGEAIVVKPSNVVNALAPLMMALRPEARAICLHAPLRAYLGSIARKGMEGRLWVRDLIGKHLQGGLVRFGLAPADLLAQTDLQVAAVGWLNQHAMFAELAAAMPDRIRTADSEVLLADPAATMRAAARLFGLTPSADEITAAAAGPAFTSHSKSGARFDRDDRAAERTAEAPFEDEIDKVTAWATAIADRFGLALDLPAPLLG